MSEVKPDIKIFVSHRIDQDSETIDNPLFVNVRCGAVYDTRENVSMLGDDTGDNISEKRESFCELTVQYWAWKNVKADYYGLFHYRRYLNFSKFNFLEDEYGSVIEEYINLNTANIYNLQENRMRSLITKYDIIVSKRRDVSKFPEKFKSIREHWNASKDLHKAELEIMLQVIAHMYPEYYTSAIEYLNGVESYFCAMHIMKRDLFYNYCEWLYPILFKLEKEIDISTYTVEGQRTVGHLAERLLGIFIYHIKINNPCIKIKELQTVLFTKPEKKVQYLIPAHDDTNKNIIPIVFASNNAFAPVCSVAIQSIIQNSNADNYYDIIILESDITDYNKKMTLSLVKGRENFSIRFFHASDLIRNYNLVANEHITVETYYRFLIQDILPHYEKVLYLDGDLVCNRDVAELYSIDISGYMLAAAHDPDLVGQLNLPNSDGVRYLIRELKLDNPYDYFQAGVLLLNVKEMRKAYSLQQWLTFASKRYKYSDQDVLNRYCKGRVKYLNMAWNMLIDCDNYRVPVIIKSATGALYREYQEARKNPYIIHFAGHQKPWKQRGVDFEHEFWKYARNTPYYEQFLLNIFSSVYNQTGHPSIGVKGAVKIYIRKKADIFFPIGTKRRRIVKRIFRPLLRRFK